MKQILNGNGTDVTATTVAYLKSNRNLFMADLYHLVLTAGGSSRSQAGFVARWTDRDYPIRSTYIEQHAPAPILGGGTFYPQRIKRGGIEMKVGFSVSTMDVEINLNDSSNSQQVGFNGPITPPTTSPILSIPTYRDSFSLLSSDVLTVAETLKNAAWKGELDQAYFYIYRGFMQANDGNVDTLGVMQLFTGYIRDVEVSRLSAKFTVAAMLDLMTTTQTPTQVIESGDRGGQIYIPTGTLTQITCNAQSGSTLTTLLGDGALQAPGLFANGWLVYNYGNYLARPANTPVIRQVYTNTQTGGLNAFFLYEPLPVLPLFNAGTGDTFTVYVQQPLAGQQGTQRGPGFPFVPKPETAV